VLAANLGLPLTPSLLGGRDFAFGGADTGVGNYFSVYPGVPMEINTFFSGSPQTGTLAQVQSFVGTGGTIAPDGLTVLWAGPNDIFTALTLDPVTFAQNPAPVITAAINNLSGEVIALYGAGARTILLPGMADLGKIPFGLASGNSAGLTAVSAAFNFFLDQAIGPLELGLPGLNIIGFDTFSFVDAAIANPGAHGFTNVTDPCFDGAVVCENPDQYVFWDLVHPTARAHLILGNAFTAAVVPEPTTVALMAIALAVLGFTRRCS
jgi:phospholipase/lecithinase/hemolysin